MAPRKKIVDNTVYTVLISGKSFEAGVCDQFPIKPVGERKRGFGYQKRYELKRPQLRELADVMTNLATPPDEDQYDEAVAEAIYKDLSRFPAAAGVF